MATFPYNLPSYFLLCTYYNDLTCSMTLFSQSKQYYIEKKYLESLQKNGKAEVMNAEDERRISESIRYIEECSNKFFAQYKVFFKEMQEMQTSFATSDMPSSNSFSIQTPPSIVPPPSFLSDSFHSFYPSHSSRPSFSQTPNPSLPHPFDSHDNNSNNNHQSDFLNNNIPQNLNSKVPCFFKVVSSSIGRTSNSQESKIQERDESSDRQLKEIYELIQKVNLKEVDLKNGKRDNSFSPSPPTQSVFAYSRNQSS